MAMIKKTLIDLQNIKILMFYDDKSITVRIDDFIPHFYLKIPTRWTDYQIGKFVNTVLKIHVRNIRIH